MTDAPNGDLEGESTPPDNLVIFAKNARINDNAQLTQLLAELTDVVWDIVLFSETRTKSGQQILDGGHMLYTRLEDNQFAGVGILLHSKHVKKSNRIHVFSGRVLALDVCIGGSTIRAVAVYLPHCGYDVQVFDEAYEQIRCAVDQGRKKHRKIILGGDFNTQANIGYRGMQLQSPIDYFGL